MQDNIRELSDGLDACVSGLGIERTIVSSPAAWPRRPRLAPVEDPPGITDDNGFGRVVGASPAMRKLYPLCRRLAASDIPVIIEGETGTGKELLAESLHDDSPRRKGPFVVLDCTSIPPNLAEAALFGHEKGAFTGATEARKGVFEEADGGTLLLDEIGDLDIELQVKLLRALERFEVSRIGSTRRIKVNVRFIAATRRNLAQLVRAGRFRDDLYFRIAVSRIELPPLRHRDGDVRLLAEMFWHRMAGGQPLPETLARRLTEQSWPGNVRELQNTVSRHAALGDLASQGAALRPVASSRGADDSQHSNGESSDSRSMDPDEDRSECLIDRIIASGLPLPEARKVLVAEFEQRYIEKALAENDGNVARAASSLGVGSRYFRMLRARNRDRT